MPLRRTNGRSNLVVRVGGGRQNSWYLKDDVFDYKSEVVEEEDNLTNRLTCTIKRGSGRSNGERKTIEVQGSRIKGTNIDPERGERGDHSSVDRFPNDTILVRNEAKDKGFDKLFVRKDSSSEESADQLFVDTAVYSRNRCFRLVLSSKAGKSAVLLPTKRFKCKDLGEEDMFMASLICNIDVDCQTYLVCKTDLECVKTLHFDTEESSNIKNPCQILRECTMDIGTSDLTTTYFMGKSPFPFLDKFILSVASVGNILVIYVVDLRMAVYYQKCHDPDCRGYRSPSRPIPVHVFSNPSDVIDSSFGLLDDEQLVDNKWRHELYDNKEQNSLQYDDDVEDNSNDSWWREAIRVVEDMENRQTKTELSTMTVVADCVFQYEFFVGKLLGEEASDDEDEEWWLAVENTASQAELASFSQQEFSAI
ncbi:hypothetical protein V8G54_011958 [Vigna mungo]|uniref:DNA-directed primase/polymerase protein n=1 Tax=Vigna mungo TaxID=3915 RepID=A0AAQ3NTA0_VIGMU